MRLFSGSRSRVANRSVILAAIAAASLVPSASAVTRVFDGGPDGVGPFAGTDLGVAANYVGDALPVSNVPDAIQFDGTVAGPLVLTYATGNASMSPGSAANHGLLLSITGTQTESLTVDSTVIASNMRLSAITIASGAGAFNLGDGVGTGGAANTGGNATFSWGFGNATHALTNDSANVATINSDVFLNTGGGGNHTFNFAGTGNWNVNNIITNASGNVALAKNGAGTATISGANTYSLGTTVAAGTLLLTGNGTLGNSTGAVTVNGGVLDFNGLSRTVGALAGSGGTVVSNNATSATLTSGSGNTGGTYAGVIADTNNGSTGLLSYVKSGSAVQILTGANTYTGTTTISGGTLQIGNNGATGSLSPASAIANSGAITLARAGTMVQGTDFGSISGAGGINVGVNGGATAVAISSAAGLSTGTIFVAGNGGTNRLDLSGGITIPNFIAVNGKANGGGQAPSLVNVSGDNTLTNTYQTQTGGTHSAIRSDAGTLTLSAATAITAGNGAAGVRGVSLLGAGNINVTGAIVNGTSSGLQIDKRDGGTVTLTGANTYTGSTTVVGGTLVLGSNAYAPVLTGAGGADLQGGRLVFDHTGGASPITTVRSLLAAGQPSNFATGQIRATTFAADASRGIGYAEIGGSQLAVQSTFYGDATLDGVVNVADLGALATNYGATDAVWAQGDFNYDAAVSVADLGLLATYYGSGTPLTPAAAAAQFRLDLASVAASNPEFAAAMGIVPEPTTLAAVGLAALAFGRRRRAV